MMATYYLVGRCSMARIAVDVDDTMYDYCGAARQELANWSGPDAQRARQASYAVWSDWRSPNDICGGNLWMDVIAKVHEDESILRQDPFPGAVDVLHELAQQHEILYISTRAPRCHDATAQWIRDLGFPDGDLVCTFESKIVHTVDCQYIIDDRPKTLVEFVYDFHWKHKYGSYGEDTKRLGFGLLGSPNLALTDVPGVYLAPSWALLRTYLVEKGGLIDA